MKKLMHKKTKKVEMVASKYVATYLANGWVEVDEKPTEKDKSE